MVDHEYREVLLAEASSALDSAIKLLDKRFGSTRWRQEWMIADTAAKVREEVFAYDSIAEAEAEAAKRRESDGKNWGVRYEFSGMPVVRLAD